MSYKGCLREESFLGSGSDTLGDPEVQMILLTCNVSKLCLKIAVSLIELSSETRQVGNELNRCLESTNK